MQLTEVITKQDNRDFLGMVAHIYANDRQYVRPPDNQITARFDSNQNILLKTGQAKRWIVKKEGRVVGRIAAFYHHAIPEKPFVGIGFFECINSQEVANLLFENALNWLGTQSFSKAMAPINIGDRDSFWGLLIKTQSTPTFNENYNPIYYASLFENYGFKQVIQQSTWQINFDSFAYQRFKQISDRVMGRMNVELKTLDKDNWKSFAQDFVTIYNQAWAQHPDFRPMTVESLKPKMKSMLPIAPQGLNIFAYVNEQPAGFFLNILDINPALAKLYGRFALWDKLMLLWKVRKLSKLKGIVFGIIPAYWHTGLEIALIVKVYEALQTKEYAHIKSVELAWIGDFNPKMIKLIKQLGATESKLHATYEIAINQPYSSNTN